MRTASVSLVVIVLALASIVAGFVGGQASSHPPAIVMLHAAALPSTEPVSARNLAAALQRVSDAALNDTFAQDDVVVDRPLTQSSQWLTPRLSVVVGLTGESAVMEAQFLRLDIPLAFDVDPNGHDASLFTKLARNAGDPIFIHVGTAPSAEQLETFKQRIGPFDGIASRIDAGMPHALQGGGLMFFDEQGSADIAPFRRAGVAVVQRDTTVDDRTGKGYITYMLQRAAMRSRRAGRVVVFMRPQPNSLDALNQFLTSGSAEIAAIR